MNALTVTLGADIAALKRGMAAAAQLVAASTRRMSAIGASGLAGIGREGPRHWRVASVWLGWPKRIRRVSHRGE